MKGTTNDGGKKERSATEISGKPILRYAFLLREEPIWVTSRSPDLLPYLQTRQPRQIRGIELAPT